MDPKDLKKNDWYLINNGLGQPVKAQLVESPKQGRGFKKVVMMDVKGSQIGLFDEIGSVYVNDIMGRIRM